MVNPNVIIPPQNNQQYDNPQSQKKSIHELVNDVRENMKYNYYTDETGTVRKRDGLFQDFNQIKHQKEIESRQRRDELRQNGIKIYTGLGEDVMNNYTTNNNANIYTNETYHKYYNPAYNNPQYNNYYSGYNGGYYNNYYNYGNRRQNVYMPQYQYSPIGSDSNVVVDNSTYYNMSNESAKYQTMVNQPVVESPIIEEKPQETEKIFNIDTIEKSYDFIEGVDGVSYFDPDIMYDPATVEEMRVVKENRRKMMEMFPEYYNEDGSYKDQYEQPAYNVNGVYSKYRDAKIDERPINKGEVTYVNGTPMFMQRGNTHYQHHMPDQRIASQEVYTNNQYNEYMQREMGQIPQQPQFVYNQWGQYTLHQNGIRPQYQVSNDNTIYYHYDMTQPCYPIYPPFGIGYYQPSGTCFTHPYSNRPSSNYSRGIGLLWDDAYLQDEIRFGYTDTSTFLPIVRKGMPGKDAEMIRKLAYNPVDGMFYNPYTDKESIEQLDREVNEHVDHQIDLYVQFQKLVDYGRTGERQDDKYYDEFRKSIDPRDKNGRRKIAETEYSKLLTDTIYKTEYLTRMQADHDRRRKIMPRDRIMTAFNNNVNVVNTIIPPGSSVEYFDDNYGWLDYNIRMSKIRSEGRNWDLMRAMGKNNLMSDYIKQQFDPTHPAWDKKGMDEYKKLMFEKLTTIDMNDRYFGYEFDKDGKMQFHMTAPTTLRYRRPNESIEHEYYKRKGFFGEDVWIDRGAFSADPRDLPHDQMVQYFKTMRANEKEINEQRKNVEEIYKKFPERYEEIKKQRQAMKDDQPYLDAENAIKEQERLRLLKKHGRTDDYYYHLEEISKDW